MDVQSCLRAGYPSTRLVLVAYRVVVSYLWTGDTILSDETFWCVSNCNELPININILIIQWIIYRLLAVVNMPMISMHVHAIDMTPKTFWNAICPRNMTIQIHWFIPRFENAVWLSRCRMRRVKNKNSFCKSIKRDKKDTLHADMGVLHIEDLGDTESVVLGECQFSMVTYPMGGGGVLPSYSVVLPCIGNWQGYMYGTLWRTDTHTQTHTHTHRQTTSMQ